MDEPKKMKPWAGEYYRRKEAGICTRCGRAPAQPGRAKCEECASASRVRVRELLARRKAAGLCPRCGKRPARPGRVMCGECAEYWREYRAAYARRAGCDGDCFNCELPDCTAGPTGRDRIRAARARMYERRKAAGLCTECGKPARPGRGMCPACAEKARVRTRMRAAKRRGAAKDGA